MKHLLKDETVLAVLATVLIHLLLLLAFLWLKVDFRPVVSEFVELSFAGVSSLENREAEPPREQRPVLAEPSLVSRPLSQQPNRPDVNLPERRELAVPEETILENIEPPLEKPEEALHGEKPRPVATLPRRPEQPTALDEPILRGEKTTPVNLFNRKITPRPVEGTPKVVVPLRENFEIDWQGNLQREIYQKRLPEFPPGVQREATIRIRFSVLPNGLVGSTVLLQKGDTQLENLTLEAFKTWRFNPLPPSVPQTEQTGIITFHFKLK
ncbi:MAG: TonB family protein [Calditrichaeota bacterium]|nr:MAG: TonB family protein [Calditrichota bacterium]